MRGGGSVEIVGTDSGTTRLLCFLAGVRDMPLRVPSLSGAEEGVCENPPPRMPREVGGSPALQLYHIIRDDGERTLGRIGGQKR